ncbi:MAG: hypothetical protein WC789_09195 [Lentisphaeria bacterium]
MPDYNDYRVPRSGWFRHTATVSVMVRHVLCLECGDLVMSVRTCDVDEVTRGVTAACRKHRLQTGHRSFRIADGRMVERAVAEKAEVVGG